MKSFFNSAIKDLLTEKEIKTLQKRLAIIKLLKTDLTYREIARRMAVSTTTIVRLNQRLKIRRKLFEKIKRNNDKRINKKVNNVSKKANKRLGIKPKGTSFFNNNRHLKNERLEKKIPWIIG